jgi:predicted NAD-dependent protein-ADP-ribosyltransferase YbiA (DUF1768 family)
LSAAIDIRAFAAGPAGALSNFAAHAFTLDGVACASMEGFLQGLKHEDPDDQACVCALAGDAAKAAGLGRRWSDSGLLWWRGVAFDRFGPAYQDLLDRAYAALIAQAPDFRAALAATGDAPLVHSVGKRDPAETVLTEAELCERLMRLRARLLSPPAPP